MRTAYPEVDDDPPRSILRRRATGIVLTLAVELLLLLLFLTLGPTPIGNGRDDRSLSTFNIAPDKAADKEKAKTKQKDKAKQPEKDRTPPVTPPPAPPVPPVLGPIPGLLVLSKSDYAAADIGKIKSTPADPGEGSSAGDSVAIGSGPNGEPLYRAEWYREPRQAELQFYYPKTFREGSALIVCKTVERYHVNNCRILGEDPPGTGLARGMVNAAWQFLVRPPRKGGQPLIGTWVSIEISVSASNSRR